MLNEIHNEDCLDTMGRMGSQFIDLVVTSPPYDDLRKYEGYSFDFENVARELYRVVKIGGVVVWVICDKTIKNKGETGTSFKQALFFMKVGFFLYDTMIWYKKNPMPTQHYRYENSFEYMFVFSKGKPRTTNILRTETKQPGLKRQRHRAENGFEDRKLNGHYVTNIDKIEHNVWRIRTANIGLHPAPFPEQLAQDHILSWSKPGDIVYDPFMGSGTVAKMASLNDRLYIGSEISYGYKLIAEKRAKEKTTVAKEKIEGKNMPRRKLEIGATNFDLLPGVPEGRSLEDAQEDIKDALEEGDSISCPCCGRFVKAYAKKLHATMVVYLIEFVAAYMKSREWVDVTTLPAYQTTKQRGDYAALRFWGLLNSKEGEKALFKPTKDGYDFIRGTIEVPSHCFQFNGEIFGFTATMVDVHKALGDKHDYSELMKAVPIPKKKIRGGQ